MTRIFTDLEPNGPYGDLSMNSITVFIRFEREDVRVASYPIHHQVLVDSVRKLALRGRIHRRPKVMTCGLSLSQNGSSFLQPVKKAQRYDVLSILHEAMNVYRELLTRLYAERECLGEIAKRLAKVTVQQGWLMRDLPTPVPACSHCTTPVVDKLSREGRPSKDLYIFGASCVLPEKFQERWNKDAAEIFLRRVSEHLQQGSPPLLRDDLLRQRVAQN